MAAVTQIDAAVVRPRTVRPSLEITPAPSKRARGGRVPFRTGSPQDLRALLEELVARSAGTPPRAPSRRVARDGAS